MTVWRIDYGSLLQPTSDESGSENNVVTVRGSDFEVFEALAMDSASTGHSKTGECEPRSLQNR